MRVFAQNRYIDVSPNLSFIKKWECRVCGKENSPQERVDTEKPFNLGEESFCLNCWLSKIKKLGW